LSPSPLVASATATAEFFDRLRAVYKPFQDQLRDIFISADTPMTKNYLRFLIEKVEVLDDRIAIEAKARSAVALMADAAPVGEVNHPEAVLTNGGKWLRVEDSK
jgi:hypothetical protein